MREEHVDEDYILQALAALAANDRAREAPPEVEARLLGAFRARWRSGRRWAVMAALAAAAALVITSLWWTNRAAPQAASAVSPILAVPEEAQPAPVRVAQARAARTPRKSARQIVAAPQPESREVVTDFFPLMNLEPSFERGQMLRVQLPVSAMQAVGLPVREEHLGDLIQADVLVGEEGMPRAIRFVRFDVK